MNPETMQAELDEVKRREGKASRTLKGKALCLIDMLTCNDDFSDNELLSLIYRIAHSAAGVCGNPHEDWQEEIHRLYRKFS